MSLPKIVLWSLRDDVYVVNRDRSLTMWEGSDRSSTRWWGEVLVLLLRRGGNAFKLTCGFVSKDDSAVECLALDGIFEENVVARVVKVQREDSKNGTESLWKKLNICAWTRFDLTNEIDTNGDKYGMFGKVGLTYTMRGKKMERKRKIYALKNTMEMILEAERKWRKKGKGTERGTWASKHDKNVAMKKPRVDEYAITADWKNNREILRVEGGAGDGRTVDCRVPLCRMPIRYRVPGLLRVKRARGKTSGLKNDVGRRYGIRTARSDR